MTVYSSGVTTDGVPDLNDGVLTGRLAKAELEERVQYYQFSAGISGLLGGLGLAQGARGLGDPSASLVSSAALLLLGALALVMMYVCMLRRSANAKELLETTRALLISERAEEKSKSRESPNRGELNASSEPETPMLKPSSGHRQAEPRSVD